MRIDLNADVGESFGAYTIGHDAGLITSITSANIAAGFHGGDPSVLRATIRLAVARGVAIGAHPGFPDLAGFGRRELRVTPQEAEDFILYQIAAVAGVAAAEGASLGHVKAHGALFNMAARDPDLAGALARAVAAFDRSLVLFAAPGSAMVDAARKLAIPVALEVFADRAYEADGQLASRHKAGALIHDRSVVVGRAVRMVTDRVVDTLGGSVLPIEGDTMCIHSDTPGADRLAADVRSALEAAGVTVKAFGRA
jgi:5-oxoprolinase (ATP-hydrolysing) subunit A